MTIAITAAPQPSFSCLMKGTSSHTPGGPAARSTPQSTIATKSIYHRSSPLRLSPAVILADCYDDQDQYCNRNQDQEQITVAHRSRGKIRLGLLHSRRKSCQVVITERRNCDFDLMRIQLCGFQCFFRLWSREEKALKSAKLD